MIIRDVNTQFGEDSNPELLVGTKAIQNMLLNLFATPYGSERFQPTLGVHTEFYLQEPIGDATTSDILLDYFEAIKKEIPQIKLDLARSKVYPNYDLPGYDVELHYTILLNNTTGILQFGLQKDN